MTEIQPPQVILLTVLTGPARGARCRCTHGTVVLGRDADADLALLDDATVSRRHASITWEDRTWVLRDLGSKNGAWVLRDGEERALEEGTPVRPGDVITLGGAKIAVADADVEDTRTATPDRLRVSVTDGELHFEWSTDGAVALQAAHPWDAARLESTQQGLMRVLAEAEATDSPPDSEAWRQLGEAFGQCLLPKGLRESLGAKTGRALSLALDPALVGMPWELCAPDGEALALRRPLVRQIVLEQDCTPTRATGSGVSIVANPTGDLPDAQHAAEATLDFLTRDLGVGSVAFVGGLRATRQAVLHRIESARVLYYLGHAEHDAEAPSESAWLLHDEPLRAASWATLKAVPELVIANACESAAETPSAEGCRLAPEGAGLAVSLLLAGVSQYVGGLWRIPSVSASAFGVVLLERLFTGTPLGEAMLAARGQVLSESPEAVHVAMAYACYGDALWHFRYEK